MYMYMYMYINIYIYVHIYVRYIMPMYICTRETKSRGVIVEGGYSRGGLYKSTVQLYKANTYIHREAFIMTVMLIALS